MNNYQVDRMKWNALSIFEQMGNIYSEVGRTFSAERRDDQAAANAAAVRAFDLFDATVEQLSANASPRSREVLRAREIFASEFSSHCKETSLDNYFIQFALAARLQS